MNHFPLLFLVVGVVFAASTTARAQYVLFDIDADPSGFASAVSGRPILDSYDLDNISVPGGTTINSPLTSAGASIVPAGVIPDIMSISSEVTVGAGSTEDLAVIPPGFLGTGNSSVAISPSLFFNVTTIDFSTAIGGFEFNGLINSPGPVDIYVNDVLTFPGVPFTATGTNFGIVDTQGQTISSISLSSSLGEIIQGQGVLYGGKQVHHGGKQVQPRPFTDTGAIHSLTSTGLLMPAVQRSTVKNAATSAVRDLNGRLFRARAHGGDPGGASFTSTLDAPFTSLMNLARQRNMDYRVLLGLRDGAEVPARADVPAGDTAQGESAGKKLVIAAPAGNAGKETVEDEVVIEDRAPQSWEAFVEADFGFYDQDNLNALVRGFENDTYSSSIGVEHRALPWLHLGGAVTRLESDTQLVSNLGGVDIDGTLLSGYFTAFGKNSYLDFLYSYGNFENEVRRNTLLGSFATGDTDSASHNVDINAGYDHQLTDQIRTGPYAGLNYVLGDIEGYAERGGGTANAVYPDDDFESMIGRLGWQTSITERTDVGILTVQGRAAWAHEFRPEADAVQASLATSPFALVTGNDVQRFGGFTATQSSAHPGRDWLEIGVGAHLDLAGNWHVAVDYEGQFGRDDVSAHFVGANVGCEW